MAVPWAVGVQAPRGGHAPSSAATISGFAYDSIGRSALSGAQVQFIAVGDSLAGRQFAAESNAAGTYVIRDVPTGRYLVAFFHAALDSLGIESQSREVEVGSDSVRVDLATPSPQTLIGALCTPNADSTASGLLLGHVRAATTESFVENASVTVVWSEWRLEAGAIREETRSVQATSRATGAFAMCNLRDDVTLLVRAGYSADASGFVEFTLPAQAVQHLTLHVGNGRRTARLTGSVHDSVGRPVPNAQVTVWESDRKARTNSNGVFLL